MKSFVRVGLAGLGLCLTLAAVPSHADNYSFEVKHDHAFGGCQGKLVISEESIRYQTDYRHDAHIWFYPQIKKIQRKDLRKLVVHTYEDQALRLGRDRAFEFRFLDGIVSDEVLNFITVRVGQAGKSPVASAPRGGRYEIAAKHLHAFGGCDGTLKITETHIEYVSDKPKDSRLWKYLDIKSLQQSSTYRLSIATYEDQALQFGRDKTFTFELKEPLEPEVLFFIRGRMNR